MNHFLANVICYSALLFGGGSMAGFVVFLISGSFQMVDFGFDEVGILVFDFNLL